MSTGPILAGCTGSDEEPDERQNDGKSDTEDGEEEMEDEAATIDDQEALAQFETAVEQVGIEVELITVDEGPISGYSATIEYYPTEMGIEWEIREITRIYLDLVESGWVSDWLEGIQIDGPIWYVDYEWVDQYLDGELSFEEVVTNTEDTAV